MLSEVNMDVLTNIIGAVESGGQVYGKRDYAVYAPPYHTTANEHTITLGWACNYGSNARKLVQTIFDYDPQAFRALDAGGIESMLSKDWVAIRWNPNTAQKRVLIALITSPMGKKAQDDLFKHDMTAFVNDCEADYTKDVKAIMMYCEIRHLGGRSAVDRIFKRAKSYRLDDIMASLKIDQSDTRYKNPVGSKLFWSRHECCKKWADAYAVTGEAKTAKVTEKEITICGHGSETPSLKNMYSYNGTRYGKIAPNGKHRGAVAVRRLKKMTDAKRKEFVATYSIILGRNTYNQSLRQFVYTKYAKTGKYYSDCSSSICATYDKIGLSCPLFNTAAIYLDDNYFETVPVTIKDGHILNAEVLKVGDCILYVGNDPQRPLQIGHVEAVYQINGGGTGTKEIIRAGQEASIAFTGHEIDMDGVRGNETRAQAARVLQHAMNLDYHAGLEEDGVFGRLSKKALEGHYVAKGETQWMVTAAEILLMLLGKDPHGVEYPGTFGNGLEAAAGTRYINADRFRSYLD